MQLQFKDDDLYHYGARTDGVHYTLAAHKTIRFLLFGEATENATESKIRGHCLWVDASAMGKFQQLYERRGVKLVPAEFVLAKYSQVRYFFERLKDIQNEIYSQKSVADKGELTYEMDTCLVRLVKSLIHDITNSVHIAETIDSEIELTIRNVTDNEMYLSEFVRESELMKNNDDEWLSLKFNNNSYYLDETDLDGNGSTLYYFAIHNTLNHIIIARDPNLKFNSTGIHHLYINQDDGLGRYKVLTKDGVILKQFFVPIDYVAYRYNRFREFMDEFKKVQLQTTSDVYTRQTNWCKLQDDAIHLMNYTLGELERDLKQEIDKSLDHNVLLASFMPDVKNFENFYNKVVDTEKKIRFEVIENTYPVRLVLFNLHNKMASIIPIIKFENDAFLPDEKVRILVSKYDADYYVLVGEAWMPKNLEIQKRIAVNYQNGNIVKLPRHEKREVLTFIAKTKNSVTQEPDKFELYEIIRERQNDEMSSILELRKINNDKLDFGMERQDPLI